MVLAEDEKTRLRMGCVPWLAVAGGIAVPFVGVAVFGVIGVVGFSAPVLVAVAIWLRSFARDPLIRGVGQVLVGLFALLGVIVATAGVAMCSLVR